MIKVTLLFLCVGKQETLILQSFEVFKTQTGIPHHKVEAIEELVVEILFPSPRYLFISQFVISHWGKAPTLVA